MDEDASQEGSRCPPWQYRGGRTPRAFSYGYEDLAQLCGVKVNTGRQWAVGSKRQGGKPRFNPKDLRSVIRFYEERGGKG